MAIISPGFHSRREPVDPKRVPPGQYVTSDFPVLSYGPTPHTPLDEWTLTVEGQVEQPHRWSWDEFQRLPHTEIITDIHCVTRWSKLGTRWEGVSLDDLLAAVRPLPSAKYLLAECDGGYTTNVPLDEVINGQAMVAFGFDGQPLPAEHGGPARLLVPHLYFWKSAKWVRRLILADRDQSGFWEVNGYNNHGDPWKEERYTGD